MTWPTVSWARVPTVSSAALRRADAEAAHRFHIDPIQLMEVAGWQVARFVDAFLHGIREKRVTVVAGTGNNGGDALVAARFLHQRGARVSVSLSPSSASASLAARHATSIGRMGIPCLEAPDGVGEPADVILDGLLGTGIRPPLREPAPRVIEAMNASGTPVIAVDVPSGLDADTAAGWQQAVNAVATVTLAAPKRGLALAPNAGRVFLAEIGVPAELFGAAADAIRALYAEADLIELVQPDTTSS
jgi:ADP-dependent NAD(P)H-hydrate dehydratase / NAD(P)H-hydrate epimerase